MIKAFVERWSQYPLVREQALTQFPVREHQQRSKVLLLIDFWNSTSCFCQLGGGVLPPVPLGHFFLMQLALRREFNDRVVVMSLHRTVNSPRSHPSLFHTAKSDGYRLPLCHYISGIVLFTTLTGQYLREGWAQGPRYSSSGCHEDEPLGYVCEARGIGVTHMPDNLAKSELSKDLRSL